MRRTDPEFALGPGTVVASADGARSTGPAHTPPQRVFSLKRHPETSEAKLSLLSLSVTRFALTAEGAATSEQPRFMGGV